MSLTLSLPTGPVEKAPLPMFRSIRNAPISKASRHAIASAKLEALHEPIVELAEPDTWYDKQSSFEVFLDMFWARRSVSGQRRSRKSYRNALKWQAAATLPLFLPIGIFVVFLNTCFGLRPKTTRLAFIASCLLAALVVSNAMVSSDPIVLAALR